MERPARFLNNIFIVAIIFTSCAHEKENLRFVNHDSVSIKHSGGIVYVNDSVFTGILFSLAPDKRDTIEISSFLDGREHGTWKKFYANGLLQEVRQFKNGKKEGKYLGWWENGVTKFEFSFKDDEYNGTCREWDGNGQITHEANYNHGHEAGEQKAWYSNGKIKSNYTIIDGRRYGLLGTKNCKNVSDSVFAKR